MISSHMKRLRQVTEQVLVYSFLRERKFMSSIHISLHNMKHLSPIHIIRYWPKHNEISISISFIHYYSKCFFIKVSKEHSANLTLTAILNPAVVAWWYSICFIRSVNLIRWIESRLRHGSGR